MSTPILTTGTTFLLQPSFPTTNLSRHGGIHEADPILHELRLTPTHRTRLHCTSRQPCPRSSRPGSHNQQRSGFPKGLHRPSPKPPEAACRQTPPRTQFPSRRPSHAWYQTHPHLPWPCLQTEIKVCRAISNYRRSSPRHVPPPASRLVENAQCLPRLIPRTVQRWQQTVLTPVHHSSRHYLSWIQDSDKHTSLKHCLGKTNECNIRTEPILGEVAGLPFSRCILRAISQSELGT